jgi:hypothetical protein
MRWGCMGVRKSDGRSYASDFFPRRQPSFMRELYCGCVSLRILYSEIGYCERKKRKLQRLCCRLYPFILLDNKKEEPRNFSGGRSPHWVNQVYMFLYCIMYLLCFISAFVLFYFSVILFFLTTGIREKGNLQEKRVSGLSGSNGRRWKV